jgi:hypothetical protein
MNVIVTQVRLILCILIIAISHTSIISAKTSVSDQDASVATDEVTKSYEKKLLWGERFYQLHFNALALEQFQKAHTIKPGAYFPQYRINQINAIIKKPNNAFVTELLLDFNKPGILITCLIIVILFSLTSMVITLFIALFNRNKMIRVEKKKQALREEYQTMLVNFLFTKEVIPEIIQNFKKVTSSRFNRRILIDQMIDLSITLTGEEKDRLKFLYLELKLDKDSYNKAMNKKWHIKAKGFRELAFMNIPTANDEIFRCLSSRNNILRQEAQFAMIRLNPENSFGFLDDIEKRFTLWEQLNVYETITFHHLDLPDFEKLLFSKNTSVVMFALRMIKVFKINRTYNSLIKLLSHENIEVRNLTIQVLGTLKLTESLPHLKRIYKNETYDNCLAIIHAMANMPDENMLSFLKLVLDKEDDVQLQIEAAIAINKISETGPATLNGLLSSDYKNYQIIVKHVLDKRIS